MMRGRGSSLRLGGGSNSWRLLPRRIFLSLLLLLWRRGRSRDSLLLLLLLLCCWPVIFWLPLRLSLLLLLLLLRYLELLPWLLRLLLQRGLAWRLVSSWLRW